MIIHYGRKKRSVLDHLLFPLISIFCCNLSWLSRVRKITDGNNTTVTTIPQTQSRVRLLILLALFIMSPVSATLVPLTENVV